MTQLDKSWDEPRQKEEKNKRIEKQEKKKEIETTDGNTKQQLLSKSGKYKKNSNWRETLTQKKGKLKRPADCTCTRRKKKRKENTLSSQHNMELYIVCALIAM